MSNTIANDNFKISVTSTESWNKSINKSKFHFSNFLELQTKLEKLFHSIVCDLSEMTYCCRYNDSLDMSCAIEPLLNKSFSVTTNWIGIIGDGIPANCIYIYKISGINAVQYDKLIKMLKLMDIQEYDGWDYSLW